MRHCQLEIEIFYVYKKILFYCFYSKSTYGCWEGVVRVLVMSHWHVEVRCMHGHASRKGETREEMFHRHWHLKIELDLKI